VDRFGRAPFWNRQSAMEPTKDTTGRARPVSIELDSPVNIAGLRILIVEDMGLIALELQTMLEGMGCAVVGMASRLSEAMDLARAAERLDGVLLDLNLAGEDSYPVTEVLHDR